MQMFGNARSCGFSDVDADIEAFGFHGLLQDVHRCLRDLHQVGKFVRRKLIDVGLMGIGHNEQMAVVIGIEVHDHKGMPAAIEDIILAVIVLVCFFAQNASGMFFYGVQNVPHAPRSPETVHMIQKLRRQNVRGQISCCLNLSSVIRDLPSASILS